MIKDRTISVLIATFNHANFIGEAIDSVFNSLEHLNSSSKQKFIVEVIVVDDGSTDKTQEVIKNYELNTKENTILKYLYQENNGQSAAYENALSAISGEIVFLLDSDDRFTIEKFQKVIAAFDTNPSVGLVAHPLLVIDSNGVRTGEIRPKGAKLSEGDVSVALKNYGRHVAAATSGLAFTTSLFKKIHPNPLYGIRSAADAYLSFAASIQNPVYALLEPLAEYRQHEGSQYFKRMTSIEGLTRSIEIQNRILNHFNLGHVMEKNSYFTRNILSLNKMTDKKWFSTLFKLNKAILADPFLPFNKKLILLIYWNPTAILPKKYFWYFWVLFQKKQTGFRK